VTDDGSVVEHAQGEPVAVYLPADGMRVLEAAA
jgi:hypothetical protein